MKKIILLLVLFIASFSFAQYEINDTATLSFTDISATGTALNLGDDDEANITTPFPVYAGDVNTNSLRIGNNGAILFDVSAGNLVATNVALSTSLPMFAPFWDDFDDQMGNVYYEEFFNVNPDLHLFIVQWDRVHYDGTGNTNIASFQIVFARGHRDINFIYADVDMDGTSFDNGLSATIGIATAAEVSQYSFNTASLSGVTTLIFSPSPRTTIPDANFEAYLETHNASGAVVALGATDSMGNGVLNDHKVPTSRIENVTSLDVSVVSSTAEVDKIHDLTGIAGFIALNTLKCENNALTALDMSTNLALTYLNCYANVLSTLDISTNSALTYLYCGANDLSVLDVSANTALTYLNCYSNDLTTLDVGANTALTTLKVNGNIALASLDISANVALTNLDYSSTYLAVDISANTALTSLYCASNALTTLDISTNTALVTLDCASNDLTTLDISVNTALTSLDCDSNALTTLDLSSNTALVTLNCYSNALTTLDLSTNIALRELGCSNTALTTLNLDTNNLLDKINIRNNPNLSTIYIQNGANNLLSGTYTSIFGTVHSRFTALNCPNLACVFVDNASDAVAGINDYDAWEFDTNAHYVQDMAACDAYYTTNVPDDNFEAYLETHNASGAVVALGAADSMGNGVLNDDTVPTLRIENVINLNIENYGVPASEKIQDLTGIEDFTALSLLRCSGNALITLDTSSNTALEYLYCHSNSLTAITLNDNLLQLGCSSNDLVSLDLSSSILLNFLDCSSNPLISLNMNSNTALERLSVNYTNIETLNLDNNTLLEKVIVTNNFYLATIHIQNGANNLLTGTYSLGGTDYARFRAGNNTNLSCVFVDNASDATAGINDYDAWEIDTNAHYVQDMAACDAYYTTNVPDDNFEAYLETHNATGATVALGAADSMGNGVLNDDTVPTSRIENVTYLNVDYQNISDLTGIEAFSALAEFHCAHNTLTNLNFYNNPNLVQAYCNANGLASISVSHNTALETLYCYDNNISTLDLSANTALTSLSCFSNDLTSLDVNTNTALTYLNCAYNDIADLDISTNTLLEHLSCYNNDLTALNVNSNLALTTLNCHSNALTYLNVSHNASLTFLDCRSTDITTLDLSTNTLLEILYCFYTPITTLNLDTNNLLEIVEISGNPNLSTVHIQNGANNLLAGTYISGGTNARFSAGNNPNLSCVFVDNVSDAIAGINDYDAWEIDANGHYVADMAACDAYFTTNVPDDNFEAYLETHNAIDNVVALGAADSMGNGVLNDNMVPTSRIENVTYLDVAYQSINDLTGIEDFVALETLKCFFNTLTTLDVSYNANLEYLSCSHNDLVTLNVSNNINLEHLSCSSNDLSTLDVSHNVNLLYLGCSSNTLTTLDVSTNLDLVELFCGSLAISTINLDNNLFLEKVNISNNPSLTTIHIQNSNNIELAGTYTASGTDYARFNASNNPNLSCVFVDNASDAAAGINDYDAWEVDASATYVEDTATCDALYVDETSVLGLNVYPNPTQDTVTISLEQQDDYTITVYNLLGEQILTKILSQENEVQMSLADLPNGVYMMRVFAPLSKEEKTIRIIKK